MLFSLLHLQYQVLLMQREQFDLFSFSQLILIHRVLCDYHKFEDMLFQNVWCVIFHCEYCVIVVLLYNITTAHCVHLISEVSNHNKKDKFQMGYYNMNVVTNLLMLLL